MANATYAQTSFLGGEWSEIAQGRIDRPEYKTAMNVCQNGMPLEQGAWTRRPGFTLGGETHLGLPARVMTYELQQNLPYTLEFTNLNLRFWSGQTIAKTNDAQVVTAISAANPAVATTTTAHGWSDVDTVMFDTLGAHDPLLMNRQIKIVPVSGQPTKFSLYDAMTGSAIDGSALKSFVSGNVSRIQVLATKYTSAFIQSIQTVQGDDQAIILHGKASPTILSPTVVVGGDVQFSISSAVFEDGPYQDYVSGGAQVSPSSTQGVISIVLTFSTWSASVAYSLNDYVVYSGISYKSLSDYNLGNTPSALSTVWKVVSPANSVGPNGFVSTDIGRHIRLNSEPPIWSSATTYAPGQTVTYGNQTYWTALATNTNVPPNSSIVHWGVATNAANWTWGKIISLSNAISGTVTGVVNIGDLNDRGGLAAAFNGTSDQTSAQSAFKASTQPTGFNQQLDNYIGQDFGASSPASYAMASATIYPTTDGGIAQAILSNGTGAWTVDAYLYASNSPPSSSAGGTLMAQSTIHYAGAGIGAPNTQTFFAGTAPVVLVPSDTTTAYRYWWVRIVNDLISSAAVVVYTNVAQIRFVSSSTGTSAGGVNVAIIGSSLINTNAIRTWRLGVYSDTTSWPTCGTYHEGRLWLSGAVKNRFDASKPNQDWSKAISFSPTEIDGTVTAANGIAYTLNSKATNSIQWMKPDQQGIILGTEHGEWLVQATTANQPLSALNIQAHEVTRQGSAVVTTAIPVFTEHTTVFIQRYARKVIEYFADIFSGKLTAPNIMDQASHLSSAADPLVELAYQQNISPTVWARTEQGKLLGCSYKRDTLMSSQGPTTKGWHKHILGSGRTLASIAGSQSPDGTLDSIAIVTTPTSSSGLYHVCFLNRIFEETDSVESAMFLDESIAPDFYEVTTINDVPNLHICGLWPLNGKTVDIYAGGIDLGSHVVVNGEVYIQMLSQNIGTIFTSSFVSSFGGAMPIRVGFYYDSLGQLLRPQSPQDSGSRTGPAIGELRRNHRIAVQLVASQDISFGATFTDSIGGTTSMHKAILRTKGGSSVLAANVLFTGIYRDQVADDTTLDGMLCWKCSGPYPATIAAISGKIETSDR